MREKRLLDGEEPISGNDLLNRKWNQGMDKDTDVSTMFNDELWGEEWYLVVVAL